MEFKDKYNCRTSPHHTRWWKLGSLWCKQESPLELFDTCSMYRLKFFKVAIPLGWSQVYLFPIIFFHIIKLCVGIEQTEHNLSLSRYPSILSTNPASMIIRLGLWPLWHPQLLMLHYEYSPLNTRLLPVMKVDFPQT